MQEAAQAMLSRGKGGRFLLPLAIAACLILSASAAHGSNHRVRLMVERRAALCLGCHGNRDFQIELPSGEKMSLYFDVEAFSRSIHGDKLNCQDCHRNYNSYPHPTRNFQSHRQYTLIQYNSCRRCHFAHYTKTLESIHYNLLSQGDERTPVCVDCHGSHAITPWRNPRPEISKKCAQCHKGIYETYLGSVHGKALMEEKNGDVPVCTDCHRAHNIEDPRTESFKRSTPILCGKCHENKNLMQKYGISTRVVETYLKDFHGVTVSLSGDGKRDISKFAAVCTDCHGIHDITKTDAPNSAVMKVNLVKTCRKCHPDATENFPAAWLSHYEPSPEKAPLVYYVKLFYSFFIPFVIGGLLFHVLLHIWRVSINR